MTIKVIINGNAMRGRNGNLERLIPEKFAGLQTDLERTEYLGHATGIARAAIEEGFDTIVIVGGDGTINEVLNGIARSDVALGIIPLGTANDLATCLGIPASCKQACDIVRDHFVRSIDVIRFNDRYFATTGGIGLPCEIARIVNSVRNGTSLGRLCGRMLSHNTYIAAALLAIARRRLHRDRLTIRNNGNSTVVDVQSLLISNQPFLGRRFLISPSARNDDGLFDVTLIRSTNEQLRDLAVVLKVLSGSPESIGSIETWQACELTVEADTPIAFLGDGEVFQVGSKVKIEIVPHALNVIVPKSLSMCHSRESGNPIKG